MKLVTWLASATVCTTRCFLVRSLGAYHDGQANECSSDDQYIMAKAPTTLSDSNLLHPYQFSQCSIKYFRTYLNKLNT